MTEYQFQEIIARYLNGVASAAEIRLVDRWYRSFGQRPDFPPVIPARELRQSMNKGFDAILQVIDPETAHLKEINLVKK